MLIGDYADGHSDLTTDNPGNDIFHLDNVRSAHIEAPYAVSLRRATTTRASSGSCGRLVELTAALEGERPEGFKIARMTAGCVMAAITSAGHLPPHEPPRRV